MRTLPNPIDQMKLFELIQIVPAPTRSAHRVWATRAAYRISDPRIMGYLRNSSIFCPWTEPTGPERPRAFRDILDAMWLFNAKLERALEFDGIKPQQKG